MSVRQVVEVNERPGFAGSGGVGVETIVATATSSPGTNPPAVTSAKRGIRRRDGSDESPAPGSRSVPLRVGGLRVRRMSVKTLPSFSRTSTRTAMVRSW